MMIESGTFFIIIFGGIVVLTVFYIVLWHILHFILCKKFDDQLFQEKYFNTNELGIYSVWPFSLVRSMGYILLVAAPNFYITKRRFKDIKIERSGIGLLQLFCWLLILSGILTLVFFLIMFVSVIKK